MGDLTTFGTISLGALINALEGRSMKARVAFNFGGCVPVGVHSYRGYYDHLAIGYSEMNDGLATVAELLKVLQEANGGLFKGYKGGTYRMGLSTPVWVANHSEAPSTSLIGVADCEYETILLTGYAG